MIKINGLVDVIYYRNDNGVEIPKLVGESDNITIAKETFKNVPGVAVRPFSIDGKHTPSDLISYLKFRGYFYEQIGELEPQSDNLISILISMLLSI